MSGKGHHPTQVGTCDYCLKDGVALTHVTDGVSLECVCDECFEALVTDDEEPTS